MLRLQIQPFPLRGLLRHPGDFWSQGILVVHSRAPGARALAPRWSLALSTEPPVRSASLQSRWGKPPCLQGSPRGAPFPFPNLTATSMILLDASTCRHIWYACTHMSEETCARDHPEVHEATYVHEKSTSAHRGARVAARLPPQGPSGLPPAPALFPTPSPGPALAGPFGAYLGWST